MKNKIDELAFFGGNPVFDRIKTTMNLPKPDETLFFSLLKNSFDNHQLTNDGPLVPLLENRLAEFHNVKYCITFCNCFVGMTIALRELALENRNEVIIPAMTYRRMADMVLWSGHLPYFCDIDPKTLGVTPIQVEPCINENTALILCPHPISNLSDIDGMISLASKYELPLFFDSVEATGGTYNGKMIGGFGDAESFSMHPSKVINGAEGGYITTNDLSIAEALRNHRNNGFNENNEINALGCNAQLNEIHAAAALASLDTIDDLIEENKRDHLEYQSNLEKVNGLSIVKYPLGENRNWKSVLVKLKSDWSLSRKETLDILNKENINARAYYYPAQYTTIKKQANGSLNKHYPVADEAVEKYMLLPFGWSVSPEDIVIICEVLNFLSENGEKIKLHMKSRSN